MTGWLRSCGRSGLGQRMPSEPTSKVRSDGVPPRGWCRHTAAQASTILGRQEQQGRPDSAQIPVWLHVGVPSHLTAYHRLRAVGISPWHGSQLGSNVPSVFPSLPSSRALPAAGRRSLAVRGDQPSGRRRGPVVRWLRPGPGRGVRQGRVAVHVNLLVILGHLQLLPAVHERLAEVLQVRPQRVSRTVTSSSLCS